MIEMAKALWSGRFDKDMDEDTLIFTSSLDVDAAMAFYDVMGSLAHAMMLKKCAIIPEEDADEIIEGLRIILDEMDSGEFEVDGNLEDIHTNVEARLTELIGPAGGKLHTGRSRNDQVATDKRMYMRDAILEATEAINVLVADLVKIAENSHEIILPGMTHTQHAQPVTLAQHMLAHATRLGRDADRFMDSFERVNVCPLGSAALAGTTYPIDRDLTSSLLAFRCPSENSMDAVSDRDFMAETEFCASMLALHLSSMAEELVLWSSSEFKFIEMDDRYSTGSSIMPQKKNPDIAELIRGKTGAVIGAMVSMMVTLKALPLTYNRDLQEDFRGAIESMDTVIACTSMMSKMVTTMKFNKKRMLSMAKEDFTNATDLADYLVTKGVPFREAHAAVGAAVRYCIKEKKYLEELKITELKGFSESIEKDVFDTLPITKCVERRNSYGGTSPSSTDVQTAVTMISVMQREEVLREEAAFIEKCWDDLIE